LENDATTAAIVTGTAPTLTVTFSTADLSACATASTTITSTTLDATTATLKDSYYYVVKSATAGYTAPTFYVATYTAAGCDDSVLDTTESITSSCTAQTDVTTDFAKLAVVFDNYKLSYGCASGCATSCDASALTAVVNGACVAGTAAWYKVATSAFDDSASGILSFAALALCALFALLF